jgi:predicted nuclease of predicted toxin-antitoxin system
LSLRLLLDENAESKRFTNLLIKSGHDVLCLKEILPKGTLDEEVLLAATRKKRVLYTQDRDFWEVNSSNQPHFGIILEFVSGTPSDMTSQQIVKALTVIEKRFSSLKNQLVIINNFREH